MQLQISTLQTPYFNIPFKQSDTSNILTILIKTLALHNRSYTDPTNKVYL